MLFVTGRNKASIENHFDSDPELFRALDATNKTDLLQEVLFEELNANFFYTRQRKQQGLGDAVLCGENFAGEQPFVVALGDSILGLHARSKAVSRMAGIFLKRATPVASSPWKRSLPKRLRITASCRSPTDPTTACAC